MSYGDPIELAAGTGWPQADPAPPVTELEFDGDLGQLRHALAADPLLAELDPSRRDDLVFAVNEAASNALRHGDGLARARVWRDADDVVGEISTTDHDRRPARRPPHAGSRRLGGRGLWLINQVCDLVEVRSGRGWRERPLCTLPRRRGHDADDRLAFLGTGVMGLPMAAHLGEAGFSVHAWNRTPGEGAPA